MATLVLAPLEWSRGLWEYYRDYTRRRVAVHAAATAALTGFGLLASVNRLFVVVAIAAYVLPPVYLYVAGDEFETDHESPAEETAVSQNNRSTGGDTGMAADSDTDTDSDSDDGDTDTDSDSDDGDTDTDSDSDNGGTDTDSDRDSGSSGGDADADADGADADADADG